jgi:histidinol-phosphate aminotransferase
MPVRRPCDLKDRETMKIRSEDLHRREALDGINARVRSIPPYTLKAIQAEVKVNQNENPFDFPDELKELVFKRMRSIPWSRYPEFYPRKLIRKLAEYYNWKENGILVGNGSNELIQAIFMVTLDKSKRLLLPQPTFTLYRLIAGILGASITEVPLTSELEFDTPEMLRIVKNESIDLIVICSPNNPTGCQMSGEDLSQLLEAHRGLLVLDEAYCEFAPKDMFELLKQYENLIITRTSSKACGMAGLRIGYCLGSPTVIQQVSKAKLPYSVNQFSLIAAETLIDALDTVRKHVGLLMEERTKLLEGLRQIPGIHAYDSKANFILFKVRQDPRRIFQALLERNILLRDVSGYPLLSGGLRVSVGTPSENQRFLEALTEIMKEMDKE